MSGTRFKASLFLQDESATGWSENFYIQSTDIATATAAFETLIPELMDLRPATVSGIWGRVSDLDVKGDSKQASAITFPVVGTYSPPGGETQSEPSTALLVSLVSSATEKNRWFLRGISSNLVEGRSKVPETAWDANFATVVTALKASWSTYVKNPSPPPTKMLDAITDVSIVRATTRRVGRPFASPRGRRTA